jgi:hypothetical protein
MAFQQNEQMAKSSRIISGGVSPHKKYPSLSRLLSSLKSQKECAE